MIIENKEEEQKKLDEQAAEEAQRIEEQKIKAMFDSLRSRAFLGGKIREDERDFLEMLWQKDADEYKGYLKNTWNIKLHATALEPFSPKAFFEIHAWLRKEDTYIWIAEELAEIHKSLLLNDLPQDVESITMYQSKDIHIFAMPSIYRVYYQPMRGKVNNGGLYYRCYTLKELPIFNTIADQMAGAIDSKSSF